MLIAEAQEPNQDLSQNDSHPDVMSSSINRSPKSLSLDPDMTHYKYIFMSSIWLTRKPFRWLSNCTDLEFWLFFSGPLIAVLQHQKIFIFFWLRLCSYHTDWMNSLVFFIWHDHHDAIIVTQPPIWFSLFQWLAFFYFYLRSVGKDVWKFLIALNIYD